MNYKINPALFYVWNYQMLSKPISGERMILLGYESVPPNHVSFSSLKEANEYREKMLDLIA